MTSILVSIPITHLVAPMWTMVDDALCVMSITVIWIATNKLWSQAISSYVHDMQTTYQKPGPWFNIKMSSYQYRKSHCGDKTVVRSSYLHNGISYTGKMSSLYWIWAQESPRTSDNTFFREILPVLQSREGMLSSFVLVVVITINILVIIITNIFISIFIIIIVIIVIVIIIIITESKKFTEHRYYRYWKIDAQIGMSPGFRKTSLNTWSMMYMSTDIYGNFSSPSEHLLFYARL